MTDQMFSRTELLLGKERCTKLQNSFVILAGIGAVGSFAFEGLVRAGVGRIRIVDFDMVEESNINRQLFAMHETLGKAKVDVAKKRAENINPNIKIETVKEFISADNVNSILEGNPDLVIDAIDTVASKIVLLKISVQKGFVTLSSMGAALRSESNMIKTTTLSNTKVCPLAATIRNSLRKEGIDLKKITCVYSEEPTSIKPQERNDKGKSILGSLPTIPGIFGLILANESIKHLSNYQSYDS